MLSLITTLELILLLLIAGSITYYVWCAIATAQFFATPEPENPPTSPPVSVMIPVCGVDDDALRNWESFCQQDYENYEMLFGVMNPKDPAVPILEKLVAKFPHRAKLIFCLEVRGLNHQVSNLIHLLAAASHEIVIFTDSDMRVNPDYIHRVTSPLLDPEIGVVTCGYVARDPQYLAAALAAFGRCIDFIPSMLVSQMLGNGLDCAFGATLATRKSVIEEIGGLESIVNRVASDYQIGSRAAAAGYKVKLSKYILETDGGLKSIRQLFQRELRWARSCRHLRGFLYYGLAFVHGTVYCLLLTLLSGFQNWVVIVCGLAIAIRIIQALIAIYNMGCPKLALWLWILPIRDVMTFVIFIAGAFGQTIQWRGRQLQVDVGGTLSEQISE